MLTAKLTHIESEKQVVGRQQTCQQKQNNHQNPLHNIWRNSTVLVFVSFCFKRRFRFSICVYTKKNHSPDQERKVLKCATRFRVRNPHESEMVSCVCRARGRTSFRHRLHPLHCLDDRIKRPRGLQRALARKCSSCVSKNKPQEETKLKTMMGEWISLLFKKGRVRKLWRLSEQRAKVCACVWTYLCFEFCHTFPSTHYINCSSY